MNILFFWTMPFKDAGGVGSVTKKLAKEFVTRGHNVTYLSLSTGDAFTDDGIEQFFFPNEAHQLNEKASFLNDFIVQCKIQIIVNQAGLDISTLEVIKAAKISSTKIFTVHHNCIKCLQDNFAHFIKESVKDKPYRLLLTNPISIKILKQLNKRKYSKFFQFAINNSDMLVLLSKKFIPEVNTYLHSFPKEKIIGIPNPASFEGVSEVENKKENRLLYVGRIENVQKQVNLLPELWQKVSEKNKDWHFDIVGEGSSLEELKRAMAKRNLTNVHFYGQQDPRPYFERAKFFIMVSSFEGFGMTLVEAQAYGAVPFAFYCFAAIEDIIQNERDGMIIDAFNMDLYVKSLSTLMNDEAKRKKMAVNATNAVSKYDVKNIANEWNDLFNKIQRV